MSADNGIYIGKFGEEYRVIHAQAIENVEYEPDFHGFNAEWVARYYHSAPCFATKAEALALASQMEDEILSDDFCPILEYGISTINFGRPFAEFVQASKLSEEALKELDISGEV